MALTTLDAKTALVVIDLQKGIVSYPTVHPIGEIVDRAARLAAAFRAHGLPVVLVNVDGRAPGRTDGGMQPFSPPPDWTELVVELQAAPDDVRVTKRTWGAFQGTSLDAELKKRGVTQIVLSGVSTSAGVESTARAAYEHGYNVVLATDAMTDMNLETHQHSVERIFPRLGETATTDEVLDAINSSSRQTPSD
jgi:nicotinamidase-related amidase